MDMLLSMYLKHYYQNLPKQ